MAQDTQQAQEAQAITIDTSGANPATNPADPAFDMATWQAAVDKAGGLENMIAGLKARFAEPAERAQAYLRLSVKQIRQLPQEEQDLVWDEMARQMAETPGFLAFMDAATAVDWKAIGSSLTTAIESAQKTFSAIMPALAIASENMRTISPALIDAGEKAKRAIDEMLEGDGIENTLQLWETLTPYMDAEMDANPELYNDAPLSALIAAAAQRARAVGHDIPSLRAEQAEQMQMQLDLPTDNTTKEETTQAEGQKTTEAPTIAMARSAGALITLGNRVATIADKLLQYCFTSHSLRQLPGKHDDFMFDTAGKLNELSLNGEPLQPLDDTHTGFLMALLQIANICDLREYNSKDNPNIGVYLPAFFRETGIDPRENVAWSKTAKAAKRKSTTKEIAAKLPDADESKIKELSAKQFKKMRADRFIEFMRPLDNRVGVIDGEGYFTLARFMSWDEKTDIAYISIPYEIKLVELARLHADRHSAISTVFHADIVNENPAAVELANRIAVGLIERGVTRSQTDTYKNENPRKPSKRIITTTAADGTRKTETLTYQPEPEPEPRATRPRIFRWESKFETLIANCPQLQREITGIKTAQGAEEKAAIEAAAKPADIIAARKRDHKTDPQRVNKKLKDTFTAAIRIIMEKSDIPQYYAKLEIKTGKLDTFRAPTNSTLKDKLVITHKGKNPNYVE